MLIFLSGPDTFRSRERLQQLKRAFLEKYDRSGVNVTRFDGAGLRFGEFQQSVASQGFLSSRRFVVVERPFEADRKTQEEIAGFLRSKSVPEQTILVFWTGGEETKKRRRGEEQPLEATLRGIKHHEEFVELEPQEVERWIVKRVKSLGGTIERAATESLASAAGSDTWLLANELEKLFFQTGGKITEAAVAESLQAKEEANIFEFTDALSKKDQKRALELLEEQFSSGAHELYLLTMIARQIRILLSVSDLAKTEPNPATIVARLKLHPFVVKKALQQVRTFSIRELLAAHDAVVEIDRRLKTSQDNPKALLELFVLRLCSG